MPDPHMERNSPDDEARARELYKYFRPPVDGSAPPDTVLMAHAQLVAWRLDSERAMISFIDEETQYFVAESTKTLHLDNALRHEHPDDAVWAGCISVPKAGRLCEHTMAALPPLDGGVACFEVLDLTKDARFNTLDFVSGPPSFKSYVGVPLRTRSGINIGSLFLIDSKQRIPITATEKEFLGVMAKNVIQHLEMLKDRKDHQRSTNMSLCMSAYVDPENSSGRRIRRPNLRGSSSSVGSSYPPDRVGPEYSTSHKIDESGHLETFGRAADLLREALDLEEGGGGVVFLDTLAAISQHNPFPEDINSDGTPETQDSNMEEPNKFFQRTEPAHGTTAQDETQPSFPDRHTYFTRTTEMLAHAYQSDHGSNSSGLPGGNFTALSTENLSKLIERYPRGKLFTFDKEGHMLSSSSDEQMKSDGHRKGKKNHLRNTSEAEADILQSHFPTARQIIFLPLWDPSTSRSSACFVYNCSDYRNFSHDVEFLYSITFSSCVMSEIARLAISKADQHKSDFIGSISHELRSPLHGILASCEFLGDTECTSFQRSLVDTADSCARTLLDTISMVLDYSKINTFEKNINRTRKSKGEGSSKDVSKALQSSLNIYRDVNLAVMTEEVVEGVATGHTFDNRSADGETNDLIDADIRGKGSTSTGSPRKSDVKVIVDITTRDWTYWGQPGALRRIVMNLFGNSLKYTREGFVHIKLEAQEVEESSEPTDFELVTLTITDSGQGISPAYLKDKLFTPFAQESNLTPGTGLGLSLVKSIVGMLDGKITVESTVGVGTKVTVKLPMTKNIPKGVENGSKPNLSYSGSNIERAKSADISLLKTLASEKTVAVYCKEEDEATEQQRITSHMMQRTLKAYLEDWYKFTYHNWQKDSAPDIIICEESDLNAFTNAAPGIFTRDCRTMVLVLCHTASAHNVEATLARCKNVEGIRYPLGPYKFARALNICFKRLASEDTSVCAPMIPPEAHIKAPPKEPMEESIRAIERLTVLDKYSAPCEIAIIETDSFAFRGDSVNAQMVLSRTNSAELSGAINHTEDGLESTTPLSAAPQISDGVSLELDRILPATSYPLQNDSLPKISFIAKEEQVFFAADANVTNGYKAPATEVLSPQIQSIRSPRMLLVDDNAINLKLLQVFMKKRKYTAVTKAEDGLQAVSAYQSALNGMPPVPPDIILMDISMPIMDGFEATRRIRVIEREHNRRLSYAQPLQNCLIIALTGLASDRDQKEAFRSGVDLYITKPVSFAKVSKLLDNWEMNGKTAAPRSLSESFVIAGDSTTP